MTKKVKVFLLVSFGWTSFIGAVLYFTGITLSSTVGIAIIATLYMPTPLVAAVIAEKGFVRERFRFPSFSNKRDSQSLKFFLLPILAIIGFVGLYFLSIFVLGNMIKLEAFGSLAMSSHELMQGAAHLFGQAAVDKAGTPPPPLVLILASIWAAIIAGWTINGLFAMGEEYGWRGLLWQETKHLGILKANIIVGAVWGFWHAPLIVQGYNYPGQPGLGIVLMMLFTIGFSFTLTALREITNSVWPAAAAHGMFNGLAVLVMIFLLKGNMLVAGPIGILGATLFGLVGWYLWTRAPKMTQR
jgi:membrane protease YdiL (CAAX protease family)